MNSTRKRPAPRKAAPRKTAPDDPWMSLPAAARALGCARQTVLNRANRGELDSWHAAGRTLISRASVERVLAEEREAEEPAA